MANQLRVIYDKKILTIFEAISLNDLLRLINDIGHIDLCNCVSRAGKRGNGLSRTPTTCFAPAFAANILRIPVPQPTSSTVLSLNKWGLLTIALR